MNLSQLYSRLLNVLAENATPQYWLELELKDYINDGLKEFVKRTRFLRKNVYLDKSDLEDGVYFLPTDIIEPVGVQYQGKPLDKKSIKFLETAYAGTSHQRVTVGGGYLFAESWRNILGDPIHWFFEDQFVKVFPKPSFRLGSSSASVITRIPATLYKDNAEIQLPVSLPYGNRHLINFYIDGVYQNIDQWSIDPVDSSRVLLPYTATYTAQVEFTYQNSAVVATKFGQSVVVGQTEFTFANSFYDDTTDSLMVEHDGIKLTASDYLSSIPATNSLLITLVNPAAASGAIEVTIYKPLSASGSGEIVPGRVADQNASLDYIYLPASLTEGTDEPELPVIFHDACWQWAAFLALSKEGAKTQDVQKASIYLEAFERTIRAAKPFTDSEIDVEPVMQMPFMV